MQELNAVVLIAVIFVPSQFLLVSVLHILPCLWGMLLAQGRQKQSVDGQAPGGEGANNSRA